MILKDASGNIYVAHFAHQHQQPVKGQYKMSSYATPTPQIGRTKCKLHLNTCTKAEDGPCTSDGFSGLANCSVRDQFEKAKGRKVALARAMKSLEKSLRRQLWKSYFEQTSERDKVRVAP